MIGSINIGVAHETKPVNWAWRDAPNKMALVLGKTGSGKTYFLQRMLSQIQKNPSAVVVLDYAGAFRWKELHPSLKKLEKDGVICRLNVYRKKLKINPLAVRILSDGKAEREDDRIANVVELLSSTLKMSAPQERLFWKLAQEIVTKTPEIDMNNLLQRVIASCETASDEGTEDLKSCHSLINLLSRFAGYQFFERGNLWKEMEENPKILIIDISDFKGTIRNALAELILRDLFNYKQQTNQGFLASEDKHQITVLLDEIQNLSFRADGPLSSLIVEGRKHGINLWCASQSLTRFKKEDRELLWQADLSVYFSVTAHDRALIKNAVHNSEAYMESAGHMLPHQCFVSGTLDTGLGAGIKEGIVTVPEIE